MQLEAVLRRARAEYRLRRPPSCPPGFEVRAPDFVGAGAQRCGTTWWYDLVTSHPDVHAGAAEELHFLHRYWQRPFAERDAAAYAAHFPRPPCALAGEWSPGYLSHFWVPPLLREAAPQARILVLLRDPVERYRSGIVLQQETRRAGASAASAAFRLGCYGRQLEHLYRHVAGEQVLVLQFERCVSDTAAELASTYRFLGLDDSFVPADSTSPRNAARGAKPVLDADHRRWLVECYEPEVARTAELVPSLERALVELRAARVTPLRIAVVGPLAMPNRQGGMSRHCEEIYARLAARGHDVTVFANRLPEGTRYRGFRIRRIWSPALPGWDRLVYSLLATALATAGPYDIVHYHSLANTGFCFVPKLTRKRVVVTVHRIEWRDEKWGAATRAYLRAGERVAMRTADALIAVSSSLKDELATRDPRGRSVRVISNGATMPGDVGSAALEQFGLADDGYILSVGRLVPDKGWDVAFAGLDRLGHRDLEYVVVGDARSETDYVRGLRARAARSAVPCKMVGTVAPETLDELYAGALVMLSPSFQEGQPLTVLEAMSHGRCIVASDIPAHVEVLGDTGALYAAKDPAALAAVLGRVLDDPTRRAQLGTRARDAVASRDDLSWDRAADETEAVYRELVP